MEENFEKNKEYILKYCKSADVRYFISEVLYSGMSHYDAIKYIEKTTTEQTKRLFIEEIRYSFEILYYDFMFNLSTDEIKNMLDNYCFDFDYIYVTKYEYKKIKPFVRDIAQYKTVFNVKGLSKEPFTGAIKLIYLNDMAIQHFNGFNARPFHRFRKRESYKSTVTFLVNHYKLEPKQSETVLQPEPVRKSATISQEEKKQTENPYPRIFKDVNAFFIFLRLQNEFGNTKKNIANYSFAFHKMTYDGLILHNTKHIEFTDMLIDFDININRIKPLSNLGDLKYKESIYQSVKS